MMEGYNSRNFYQNTLRPLPFISFCKHTIIKKTRLQFNELCEYASCNFLRNSLSCLNSLSKEIVLHHKVYDDFLKKNVISWWEILYFFNGIYWNSKCWFLDLFLLWLWIKKFPYLLFNLLVIGNKMGIPFGKED